MTREEAIAHGKWQLEVFGGDHAKFIKLAIEALEQEPCEDCVSRADALRVAKNEYLRGWHEALCKALSEKYSIHCEEGNFSVIQEETITGLGLSIDCAVGKDVESYMSTIPSVAPTTKWIPVSEKLPNPGEHNGNVDRHYLVQNEYGDMLVARYAKKGCWEQIFQFGEIKEKIVAWQPLPKPYNKCDECIFDCTESEVEHD